jgi:hypothetical protein
LEKNSDADLLREMVGFVANRLMELAELWHPSYHALCKSERFKKTVRDEASSTIGARVWPASCRSDADDFECY